MTPPPLRLAVIGDPVAHSLSPAIHRDLMLQAGRSGSYDAIRVPPGEAETALRELRAAGYRGVNVTTPLKEEAFACCGSRQLRAQAARSVNTVLFERDGFAGYDTDGPAAVAALLHGTGRDLLDGMKVLVLGAGPTARVAMAALRDGAASVSCWNRTPSRAAAVCEQLGVALWEAGMPVDAVLSTLPPHAMVDEPSLRRTLLDAPVVVDANYGVRSTLGATIHRNVIDGTLMLHAGARAAFALFTRTAE